MRLNRDLSLTLLTKTSNFAASFPIVVPPSTAAPVDEAPVRNHADAALAGKRSVENSHVNRLIHGSDRVRHYKMVMTMAEQLRGAEIFVRALADEGVEFLFGYPGGSVLHIYDEIFKQDKFKHILVRHEQGATHAADGYARATGKPGVVLVTSGPGTTNCVTGIATAYMDSIPLVVFTGQVSTALIGNDAFQEVDCIGITRPCVKHNFLVERV